MCLAACLVSVLLAGQGQSASPSSPAGVFSSVEPVDLTLSAPLGQLFTNGTDNEDYSVMGTLSYGGTSIPDVEISVRGNTSRRETECTFPKLKLKFHNRDARDGTIFAGLDGVRIGTHCGESPGEALGGRYGRLSNEKSPRREAFVYRLLGVVGVPTLRARPARITYIDRTSGAGAANAPLTRNAVLIEDDEDAKKRLGGIREIDMEEFRSARDQFAPADAVRIAFGEALIGNFDWCLKFTPDDTYRCDERKPLWNVLAFERHDGPAVALIKDFDLAGPVTGRHIWFNNVFNPAFVASHSPVQIEVLSQVQRTRSLFSRAQLDLARRAFLERRDAAYEALERADLDQHGRDLARAYMDAFFNAIDRDDAFYIPVVAADGVRLYVDAERSGEACSPGDTVPVGTPVSEVGRTGTMAQVVLLDYTWHWSPPHRCQAAQTRAVWIAADSISTSYPAK